MAQTRSGAPPTPEGATPELRLLRGDSEESVRLHAVLQRHRRSRGWRRLLRVGTAVLCILLGVAGLFLPVLQGILLLALGFALLGPDFPPARRLMTGVYRRWPRLRRRVPRLLRRIGRGAGAEQPDSEPDEMLGPGEPT